MKKTISFTTSHCLHEEVLPLGCWSAPRRKGQIRWRRLFRRYQKELDTLLAATAIGLMFLVGIWAFLVELASLSFHA